MNYSIKTPNPICRLFFKIDLFADFAALCLTDFIDWRYIHSVVCIFNPGREGLRNNTSVLLPLYCTFSLISPPPSQNKCAVYTDSVSDWGGDVELCCRPYSAVVYTLFLARFRTYKIATASQTNDQ
jgi:hypothetical protein